MSKTWITTTLEELQNRIHSTTNAVKSAELQTKYKKLIVNKTFWEQIELSGIADESCLKHLYDINALTPDKLYQYLYDNYNECSYYNNEKGADDYYNSISKLVDMNLAYTYTC